MFIIDRPLTTDTRQWTGSNYAELVAFAPEYGFTLSPGGDLITGGGILPVGTWIQHFGIIYDAVTHAAQFQDADQADFYVLDSRMAAAMAAHGVTPGVVRRASVAVPAIGLLGRQTVAVTWQVGGVASPMPSADYDIILTQVGGAAALGNVNVGVVSQTAAGCVIGFYAVLAVAIGTLNVKVRAVQS